MNSIKGRKLILLGKSHYALSIILDMIQHEINEVLIVPNIAEEQNESNGFDFLKPGLQTRMIDESELPEHLGEVFSLASIGRSRRQIYKYFADKYNIAKTSFVSQVHSSAVISNGVTYGDGFHLSPLSVIAPFTTIGDFVVINRNVSIGHHCTLRDFVTVNPGVNMAGICDIGENTILGLGSTIIDKVKIGANTIIGAGSVVTKDLPSGVIAYGNPAKIIRDNI